MRDWHNWITYENTCIQHLSAVFRNETFEKDPWKKNFILSVDFSRNYDNKQLHEIQSAYFGHKYFTIFTAACYVHKDVVCNGKAKTDKEFGLNVILIAIISNEITHDRDVAFTNNQKLIQHCPRHKSCYYQL